MNATRDRRALVAELLLQVPVASQAELLLLLEERGFETTQPMLSRDLHALGAGKVDGTYRLPERVTPLDKLASLLRGARTAGRNLLVVRCEPGAASAVARALEADEQPGIVGTVAGDDTIFVAAESTKDARRIQERIRALVP